MNIVGQDEIKLHWTHKRRIVKFFEERYTLEEIYIMYRKLIPYKQLRKIVRGAKRPARV